MKTLRLIHVLVLVGLLLTTFVVSVQAQDDLSGVVTVSVEAWMVEKYNMAELEARFEAAHPNVDVIVITHEGLGANYLNIFLEWAQTGQSTADLYFGGLVSQIAPAVIDDQLVPWDDVMVDELAPEMWIPAFLNSAYVSGEAGTNYPTLPGLGETMNFQYNVALAEAAGLLNEEGMLQPASYDEILTAACALAELEVDGQPITGLEMEYGINFAPDTWMAAVIAAEGTYLAEDGSINWSSEAGRQWIEFQKSVIDAGCGGSSTFTDNNGARNALKAGQAAIINASNSRSNEGTNALCPETEAVAIQPEPQSCPSGEYVQMFGYPGDGGVMAFSHQIYIPRVAQNIELARAFATEAILGEYGQTWSAIAFGKMPTIWANYDALAQDNPNFAYVRAELEGPSMGQWVYRDGQLLRQAYVDELQLYLTGQQTLDDMINNLNAANASADLTIPDERVMSGS
jgi:ABC-type glycerol-3-phosphate transport system substrate-binding protein